MAIRKYSLYRRLRTARRWERISPLAMRKDSAVRFFQGSLLANAMGQLDAEWEYQLRTCKD